MLRSVDHERSPQSLIAVEDAAPGEVASRQRRQLDWAYVDTLSPIHFANQFGLHAPAAEAIADSEGGDPVRRFHRLHACQLLCSSSAEVVVVVVREQDYV